MASINILPYKPDGRYREIIQYVIYFVGKKVYSFHKV